MEIDKDLDVVHERAAGLDISKRDAKLCVRVPGARPGTYTSKVTTWAATTGQVLELREYLEQARVDMVVMEATSDYWKPFYYLLEETVPVMLVNAKSAKNLPGHKTDVKDAAWLARMGAYGLLRASFVPPEPIRDLRDLTRARAIAARDRGRGNPKVGKVPRRLRDQTLLGRLGSDRGLLTRHARSPHPWRT
jgi:transposase